MARVLAWDALWRSRRKLAHLDDHLLADIGLDRETARAEAERKPWNAPETWLR